MGSWEALFELVRQRWPSVTTDISEGVVAEMRYLCQLHGWPIPSRFEAKPPIVLIHWRPLLFMVDQLSSTRRKLFRVNFSSCGTVKMGTPAVVRSGESVVVIEETPIPIHSRGSVQVVEETPVSVCSSGEKSSVTVRSEVTVAPNMRETQSMIPVPSQVGSGFLVGSCPGRMGGPSSGNACAPVMPAPRMGIRAPTCQILSGPELRPSVTVVQGPRVGTRGPSVDVGAPKPLKGFDAHFHLDRMRAHMKSTPKTRVDHAAQQPRVPITVTGGVRNYCDSDTTPRHRFRADHRVLADVNARSSRIDFVKVFLTQVFITQLIDFTKTYANKIVDAAKRRRARQTGGPPELSPRSRYQQWNKLSGELNIPLMLAFMGLFFNMGLVRKANIQDYWNQQDWSQYTPCWAEVMAKDCFLLLMRFVQFYDCDDEEADEEDPWRKVKYVYEHFNQVFRDAYIPGQHLTIDEGLVGFRGRSGIIQYMPPKKHHKFGIKNYELCETNGYTIESTLSAGSELRIPDRFLPQYPNRPDTGGEKISNKLWQ